MPRFLTLSALFSLGLFLTGCLTFDGTSVASHYPRLTLSATPNPVPVGEMVTVTFTVNEAVTGLSSDTVELANGVLQSFSQTDTLHYAMTVQASMTPGTLTITVPANTLHNNAGESLDTATTLNVPIVRVPDAPWATAQGEDAAGFWADLTVSGNGVVAVQRFRWIAAGTFTMGSPGGEAGREAVGLETQHAVTLTRGFWMADSPCTQRLWKAVTNTTPSSFTADGLDLPVEQVSWDDIQGANGFFSTLVALNPAFPGALPTEAQWEYTCRAGTTTPFAISPLSVTTLNCRPQGGDPYINVGAYRAKTTPVKSLNAPNGWGLHDMHGNVWEWCADWYGFDLGATAAIDPDGPVSGSGRVLRGGSWDFTAANCRSAVRSWSPSNTRNLSVGFRLCALGQPRIAAATRSTPLAMP